MQAPSDVDQLSHARVWYQNSSSAACSGQNNQLYACLEAEALDLVEVLARLLGRHVVCGHACGEQGQHTAPRPGQGWSAVHGKAMGRRLDRNVSSRGEVAHRPQATGTAAALRTGDACVRLVFGGVECKGGLPGVQLHAALCGHKLPGHAVCGCAGQAEQRT